MQSKFKTSIVVLAVAFACAFAAKANAECGNLSRLKVGATLHRQSWLGFGSSSASLLLVADKGEPIVGLWEFTMTSEGTTGIPDGTVVDQGFSEWHSDGTEVTVSGLRAPVTGDVCLGAWKTTGGLHYSLSHYGISYDTTNTFVGLAHITENVAVTPGGKTFSGPFTIDQFDQSGNTLAHITGQITGTKITADSPTIVTF